MNENEGDGLPTISEDAEAILQAINEQLLANEVQAYEFLDHAIARSERWNGEVTDLTMYSLLRAWDLFVDLGIEPEFEVQA